MHFIMLQLFDGKINLNQLKGAFNSIEDNELKGGTKYFLSTCMSVVSSSLINGQVAKYLQ